MAVVSTVNIPYYIEKLRKQMQAGRITKLELYSHNPEFTVVDILSYLLCLLFKLKQYTLQKRLDNIFLLSAFISKLLWKNYLSELNVNLFCPWHIDMSAIILQGTNYLHPCICLTVGFQLQETEKDTAIA